MQKSTFLGFIAVFLLGAALSSQARAEDKAFSGLTSNEFWKVFNELSEKWHPTYVKGYAKDNMSYYDVNWKSGNPGFYMYFGVSTAHLTKYIAEHTQEGYKLTLESTWKIDGRDVHAAIFRKK